MSMKVVALEGNETLVVGFSGQGRGWVSIGGIGKGSGGGQASLPVCQRSFVIVWNWTAASVYAPLRACTQ